MNRQKLTSMTRLFNPALKKTSVDQSWVEWKVSTELVPYLESVRFMEERVEAIEKGEAQELVWLLEHPPLYTLGTSAKTQDILRTDVPAFETGRGGQVTFHGPGQRIVYVLLNLSRRERDVKAYIWQLEEWLIQALKEVNVVAERRQNRVGLWVEESLKDEGGSILKSAQQTKEENALSSLTEKKIAAIGVRIRRWITYHGLALNVSPDLSYFKGIVPCGLKDFGVTSLEDLRIKISMIEMDSLLKEHFFSVFKPPVVLS